MQSASLGLCVTPWSCNLRLIPQQINACLRKKNSQKHLVQRSGGPIPACGPLPLLSPELIWVADGLRAAQLGVQVVIEPPHLSDSYPVLALQRQTERAPAHVRRHVQNEARHVGKLDAANIPARKVRFWVFSGCGTHVRIFLASN